MHPHDDPRPIPRILKDCRDCGALIWRKKPSDLCDPCIDQHIRMLADIYEFGGSSDWYWCAAQAYGQATRAPVRWQDAVEGAILYAEHHYNWPLYGRGRGRGRAA